MEFLLDDDLDIDLDRLAPPRAAPSPAEAPAGTAAAAAMPAEASPAVADAGPPAQAADEATPAPDATPLDAAWFEAASAFGPLWLCVQTDAAIGHAAAAAVVLQQAGALLDALDDWSALELDWRWTPVPQAADAGSHVVARWPADDEAAVAAHLVLPWALVRHMPPPVGLLRDGVRWEPTQAIVVVARLALGADDVAALEAGGAVVLPESMHADWRGVLRARGEPLDSGTPLALAVPHAPQVVARDHGGRAPAGEPGTIACEVRLDRTPMVAIHRLAGWSTGDIGNLGSQASLWRCDGPPRRCAGGSLMRWGDGWALALESL